MDGEIIMREGVEGGSGRPEIWLGWVDGRMGG